MAKIGTILCFSSLAAAERSEVRAKRGPREARSVLIRIRIRISLRKTHIRNPKTHMARERHTFKTDVCMFVSHEFASLHPADFVGRTKCRKNFFCWNLIFSMQLSPSGQLLWNSRHFKGYDVFFHIFSIICRISRIWEKPKSQKLENPKIQKSKNPKI